MASDSKEAWQAKAQALLAHAETLEAEMARPFDPKSAGLLAPERVTAPKRKATKSRLSDMSGSATLRGIGLKKKRRQAEEAAHAAAAQEKREAAALKKQAEEALRAADIAGFELCEGTRVGGNCMCTPACAYAKWVRCPAGGPKSSVCRVRACVDARKALAPLLLEYSG